MAADNSQQKLFYLLIEKEIGIILISQNGTVTQCYLIETYF